MQAAIVCFRKSPTEIQDAYLFDGEGTQVTLMARDEVELRRAHIRALEQGIPSTVVIDDERPVAIGIGPVTRAAARRITKGLSCMK
jgi:hypothetical protein